MFAVTLVLVAIAASWVLTRQQPESVSVAPRDEKRVIEEPTTRADTRPAPSLPAEDVPGKDMPDLPRYPGSVRVEYERKELEPLVFTRVRYLSRARLDVIRGFYRGVFRAEGWKVANVEFSEDRWTFLVLHGEREANIMIEPHDRDVTRVDIRFSEPLPEKKPAPEERPQRRKDDPAPKEPAPSQPATSTPTPAPQTASPAPQSVSPAPQPATPAPRPAPVPDYDDDGGEGWDDLDDDGGGDD